MQHLRAAVPADALRQRVRGEPARGIHQDDPDPGVQVRPCADALAGQAIDAFSSAGPRGTLNFTDPELDAAPAQFVKCGLLASDSVTVAFLTTEAPPKPRPVTVTVCAVQAALVTVTGHDAAAPGLPDVVELVRRQLQRRPRGSQPGADEASSTALRLFSSPLPCSVAGAPRSVAVDSRICLTAAGLGGDP